MKIVYCTYFDRNYLPRGLAMIDSLLAHEPAARIVVLCLDKITQVLLSRLCPPAVTFIDLKAFEKEYPELLRVKPGRKVAEYCWTMTPVLLLHVMRQQSEGDGVIYLDADQLFFSSPKPVVSALRRHSVCLQPHRFPKRLLQPLLRYGRYNVGVLGARNDVSGRAVIGWWRERCLEWCHDFLEGETRFGDQKYLDYFAEQADGVGEFHHAGIGVAPWNHENAVFSLDEAGTAFFGKAPLVIFHFHSLVFADPDVVVATRHHKTYCLSLEVIRACYAPYLAAVDKALARIRGVDPQFSFGISESRIDAATPLLVRNSQVDELCRNLPHTRHSLDGDFTYCEPREMPQAKPSQAGNQWQGAFATWEEAATLTTGYDTEEITRKAVAAARAVRDGKAVCERDTVVFQERQYLWPTVSGVLLGAARNGGEVHLVDFGGGLGSMYHTMSPYLRGLKKVRWHVVELPNMVAVGKREFQTDELRFHEDMDACLNQYRIDGILLGGVLQYLPSPYSFLASLTAKSFDYIILDRTPFHPGEGDRICLQQVPELIYKASYPCWMLDYNKCLSLLLARYSIVDTMLALEGDIQQAVFKGIIATVKADASVHL